MIQDDWLVRQFAQLAQALAGVRDQLESGDLVAANDELERLAGETVGLSLTALDRFPLPMVVGSLASMPEERRKAAHEVLLAAAELADLAGDAQLAGVRRAKAQALS